MKKLHLILLGLLAVSLITYCPASSSGNPPPVDNMMRPPVDNMMPPPVDNMMPPPVDNMMPPPVDNTMQPPTDITTVKTIHAHVNNDVDNAEVVALSDSITVTEPTYSILEGNDANIFSINSSTGVITLPDASKVTYDAADKTNNIHLLKVRVRNGTDTTKATEAPLRIVVRGFGGAFITTWTTTETDETITIPTESDSGNSVYSYTVHWGDSPQSDTTTYTGDATHTYAAAGTYTVRITGTFSRIYFNNFDDNGDGDPTGDNKTKIKTVEQWGSIKWGSMEGAFNGAENLTVPAVDAPDLTKVTSMRFMFQNASVFNQDISSWNTENINNMSAMFSGATAFNQDISKWNTAMVTDMSFMFSFTDAFNQDISKWNTAMVTNMSFMFTSASAFNQDISKWNTAMVMSMSGMFAFASAFNQNIRTSGNSWNTAMVADMSQMFQGATVFNQDISGWNVDAVTAVEKCSDFADSSVLINANWPTFMNAAAACNP